MNIDVLKENFHTIGFQKILCESLPIAEPAKNLYELCHLRFAEVIFCLLMVFQCSCNNCFKK